MTADLAPGVMRGPSPAALKRLLPARYSHVVRDRAAATPDAPALYVGDLCWSYGDLWARTQDAIALLEQHGVGPGDRVLIVAENGMQIVPLLLAASERDAWGVPLNARMSDREIETISKFSDCRLQIYCVADSASARVHAVTAKAEIVETPLGPLGLLADPSAAAEPVFPDNAHQTAVLVFTSGTTGEPKGVMVSHLGLLVMGANMAILREVRANDVFYNSSPISHSIGLGTVLMTAFWAGASARLVSRFDANEVLDLIAAGKLSSITGVPTLLSRLLDRAMEKGRSLYSPAMRIIAVAGAPLDPALKARIEEAFQVPLGNSYALTECNPIARSAAGVDDNEVGTLQPGVEIRLVDADERDVAAGAPGELWVRAPHRMLGYYRNPRATAAALRDGDWLATGDIAALDDAGKLRIVGRTKDLIIRSGFNVYPVEVEAVIADLPGVAMVAVVGRPVQGNEEVVAYVQPLPGATLHPEDLAAAVHDRLAPYKRPSVWRIERELPIGPTGKIMKIRLKDIEAQSAAH